MNNVKQQQLDLMKLLYERASLNPEGEPFRIKTEQFVGCPDYEPLLEKLEKQYKVIEINQRPDERRMGAVDHDMFSSEQPDNYARYMSYYITLEPTFEDFYAKALTEEEPIKKIEDYDDATLGVMVKISHAFIDSSQKPVEIPQSEFDELGLSFETTTKTIKGLVEAKSFQLVKAPKSKTDNTPYKLALTPQQTNDYKQIKIVLEEKRDLQMLLIYFGRICNIYDTIAGGYMGYDDPQLSHYYTRLTIKVEDILAGDSFKELKEEMPFIYEGLLGNYEDLDISWEYMRPTLMNYYSKLEKKWLKEAPGSFTLKKEEQQLIDETDEAIEKHRDKKAKIDANFVKKLEQDAPAIREKMFGKEQQDEPKTETPAQPKSQNPNEQPKEKIKVHDFEPDHYNKTKGVLQLSATHKAYIAVRGNAKRPGNKGKYDQCRLMELLFKNVNTLRNGITLSQVLGVNAQLIDKNKQKKVSNMVQEINQKIADVGAPKNLIKIQSKKVIFNASYLE